MTKPLNRAKCGNCGDIIISRHRHDWVCCSCFKNELNNTGIFVDGGNDYCHAGGHFENFLVFRNRKWVMNNFRPWKKK